MRVLIAHNRYRNTGGEETDVNHIEEGLRGAGIEVRRFEKDSTDLEHSRGKRLTAGFAVAYRPGGGGIGRAVAEWRPDVVHFHNLWPLLTPAALRAARLRGAAVVLTTHNYRFACPGGTLLRGSEIHDDCIEGSSLACGLRNPRGVFRESVAYGIALEVQRRFRLLERWVDAFIAPSHFVGRMLVRAGLPERRVHVIPYGVPSVEKPAGIRRYALYAGRLSEEKGVRTLLEAARMAPEVPVAFAGSGPLEADVRGAQVAYLGRFDGPSPGLIEALSNAAFAIVPSEWYEVLGFAALEAFAVGKPVIATPLGGLPEFVRDGETGLLVKPRSPKGLAQAMRILWHQPDVTEELGERALQYVRERFSLQRQIQSVTSLYELVTSQSVCQ